MDLHSPKSLGEVPHAVRVQVQALPERWRGWRQTLRDDPAAALRSPLVRITLLVLLAAGLLAAGQWLIGALTPAGARGAFEQATPWATLYVACNDPNCGRLGTTQQSRSFNDWPLRCPTCGQESLYRAGRCTRGHWFAAGAPGATCPHCGAAEAPPAADAAPPPPKPKSHDDEDPWGG